VINNALERERERERERLAKKSGKTAKSISCNFLLEKRLNFLGCDAVISGRLLSFVRGMLSTSSGQKL